MNTPSNKPVISEKMCLEKGMLQSKWVALDKKSQVSLSFGTYI